MCLWTLRYPYLMEQASVTWHMQKGGVLSLKTLPKPLDGVSRSISAGRSEISGQRMHGVAWGRKESNNLQDAKELLEQHYASHLNCLFNVIYYSISQTLRKICSGRSTGSKMNGLDAKFSKKRDSRPGAERTED